jgi:CheY-like chemotaxis protein
LADDSVTIQKVVNLTFADEGVEVTAFGDGDAAVEHLSSFTPDLVMVDVNMPGRNGYEICELIKSDPATSHIPVILLVGSFEPFDEDEAKRVGADDYMTKPFQSIRQLVNKVGELLNRASSEAAEAETVPTGEPETPEADTDEQFEAAEAETVPTGELETPETDTDGQIEAAEAETPQTEVPDETLAMKESAVESESFDYGDAGMDDEMIEASPAEGFTATAGDDDDSLKTQPLNGDELKELAFVSDESETIVESTEPATAAVMISAPSFEPAAPISIDESNPLDLPSLVEETGIRASTESIETEPAATAEPPAAPVVTEEMIAAIATRVADKFAERIARALDGDVVREVTAEVLREIAEPEEVG